VILLAIVVLLTEWKAQSLAVTLFLSNGEHAIIHAIIHAKDVYARDHLIHVR
jgi:hypothetical protein